MNNLGIPGPFRIVGNLVGMRYSEPEAEDAWQRILTLFGEHLSVDP
jgi:carboxymethylenebutenolidase